jgi:hypothetical protein
LSTYYPDSWVPILITSKEHGPVYKILAGWYGGFADANSWKLSSGVESIQIDAAGILTMPQTSGSIYVCGQQTHMSSLMMSVYNGFVEAASDGAFTIEVLDVVTFLDAFLPK